MFGPKPASLINPALIFPLMLLTMVACGDDENATAPTNHAPEITVEASHTAQLGETSVIDLVVIDPDGDAVTTEVIAVLTASELRSGVTVDYTYDSESDEFRFTPKSSDLPRRSFVAVAVDARGAQSELEFAWWVRQVAVTIVSDRPTVSKSEPVTLSITITNHGSETVSWEYTSSSCMATALFPYEGAEWAAATSSPRVCTPDAGTWLLTPGNSHTESVQWNAMAAPTASGVGKSASAELIDLEPGIYEVFGFIGGFRGDPIPITVVE